MNKLTSEKINSLGEWWKLHSNDHVSLIELLKSEQLSLEDFCWATGQHEASLAEWLIQNGADENIAGYNRLDTKWDTYFRRAIQEQTESIPKDSRFTIGI